MARRSRFIVPKESEEQKALVRWAQLREATLQELDMLVSIPNGGLRNRITGALLKSEGARAEFPDLFLFVPRPPYCGLAIEMKRRTGGRLSPEQAWWLERLQAQGYCVTVSRGFDEARQMIENYLGK